MLDKNKKGKYRIHLSDQEILVEYKHTQDIALIGELFQRYTHLTFGVCLKYYKDVDESKDAVVLIFEKLIEDLKTVQIDNFTAWLHTVARNHCLMELRKRQSLQKKHEELKNSGLSFMETKTEIHLPDEDTIEKKLESLSEALAQLPEEQKKCVELFYLHEKSYQEVAQITGYDLKQVKSYLQNGKRKLKNIMVVSLVMTIKLLYVIVRV
jgi:RNA polymerase sigma-70 factor (ECF subfamily)